MTVGIIIQTALNVKNFSGRINGGTSVDPLVEEKSLNTRSCSPIVLQELKAPKKRTLFQY